MAEDNKELMKRDLVVIKKLHKKTDYTQRNNLKLIYDYALSKELLKSNLGEKYLARLMSLYENKNIDNTCIICGKSCEDNPLVCNQCNHKLLDPDIDQKSEIKNDDIAKTEAPIVKKEVTKNVIKNAAPLNGSDIQPNTKTKKRGKKIATVIFLFLFLCFLINRISNPNGKNISSTTNNNVTTDNKQKDIIISSEETPLHHSRQNSNASKSSKNHDTSNSIKNHDTLKSKNNHTKSKPNAKSKKEKATKNDYFHYTENELMSKIQDTLVKHNLDIGTKEGYPHIFFVLDHGTVSNVAYQVALNSSGKVVSVSVNVVTPINDLTVFSKAVALAILTCDPSITNAEMKSLINHIHSDKVIKMNGISYFAGASTDNLLSYIITKAYIPDQSSQDQSKSSKPKTKVKKAKKQKINELSPILGMTPDEVHKILGTPISSADNTEYYSDILSIVYDNGSAYKIILGLDERFDFTQIEIPKSIYTIQNIHLGDTEAAVHNLNKNSTLFIIDGVFYGNTYQIKHSGYYVNIDYFTLQNNQECPIYRLVLTRLNQVE